LTRGLRGRLVDPQMVMTKHDFILMILTFRQAWQNGRMAEDAISNPHSVLSAPASWLKFFATSISPSCTRCFPRRSSRLRAALCRSFGNDRGRLGSASVQSCIQSGYLDDRSVLMATDSRRYRRHERHFLGSDIFCYWPSRASDGEIM